MSKPGPNIYQDYRMQFILASTSETEGEEVLKGIKISTMEASEQLLIAADYMFMQQHPIAFKQLQAAHQILKHTQTALANTTDELVVTRLNKVIADSKQCDRENESLYYLAYRRSMRKCFTRFLCYLSISNW